MFLTMARPKAWFSRHDLTKFLPQPTADQVLQRQIEDTLMTISNLPESAEKVLIDIGEDAGFFEIQWNQLELFMKLERLVEHLSQEKKKSLIAGLHPAMSVSERRALKLVLEKGLRGNLIPRPLNIRKVVQVHEEQTTQLQEDSKAEPPTFPPRAEAGRFIFLELTPEEMVTRQRELSAANGIWEGELDTSASRTSTESKKHRQEIAKIFSRAAKQTQSQAKADISVQEKAVPKFKGGLQKIKSATSAIRAYTDASPRNVVVRPWNDGSARSSQETVRPGEKSPRPSQQSSRPSERPHRTSDQAARPVKAVSPDSAGESLKHQKSRAVIQERAPQPSMENLRHKASKPAINEQGAGGQLRHQISRPQVFDQQSIQYGRDQLRHQPSKIAIARKSEPFPSKPPDAANDIRPSSDSAASKTAQNKPSGCPWPETFFTAPRIAPRTPRTSPTTVPDSPPRVPPKSAARFASPGATKASSGGEGEVESPRAGSVAAARATLAERMQRERRQLVQGTVAYQRSSEERLAVEPTSMMEEEEEEGEWEDVEMEDNDEDEKTWGEV